jgi:hypothetical protein
VSWILALVFQTFAVFIEWPLAAFLPAAIFAGLYYAKRRTGILVAALCWAGYATLETLNKARISCSGECNIRVDLLLIYPVLWIVSIAAIVLLFRPRKPHGAA